MTRVRFVLAAVLALGLTPIAAQQSAPLPVPTGDKAEGFKLFLRYGCFQCHGTVGQGAAVRFGPKIAPDPISFAAFRHQLRNPHNPIQTYTPMPVYTQKILTEQQVADIYAYLKSIPPAKKAADIPLLNLK